MKTLLTALALILCACSDAPKFRILTDGAQFKVEENKYGSYWSYQGTFSSYADAREAVRGQIIHEERDAANERADERDQSAWKEVKEKQVYKMLPCPPVPTPTPALIFQWWGNGHVQSGQYLQLTTPTPTP